jgi:Short C-terminal domain
MSDIQPSVGDQIDKGAYANWYEWATRTVSKEQNKAHAAAWAATLAGAKGADSAEMEKVARQAAKDKSAVNGPGADAATRSYAEWFQYAVTTLGVTGDTAHRAAAAAQSAGTPDEAALAAEQAAGVHGNFSRAHLLRIQREQAFARAELECPFPITKDKVDLPGGLQLMSDEFLVTSGKDWGFSSQRILITTHRAIWTHGRILNKQQNAIYLTDIRDVIFRKPMIGYGSLAFETSSGHVIEALPSVGNGAQVRNSLLTLIHYARNRAQQPQAVPVQQDPAVAAPSPDRYEQLRKLGELKSQGVLSEEEFQAEKAKILAS